MSVRNKYRYNPYDNTSRHREEKKEKSNCDALIHKIAVFFFVFDKFLSPDDKQQILSMLQEIEEANKTLPFERRVQMYNAILEMKQRY
nr:hypothetical protein [Candidatus Enterousia merdequi]